MHCVQVKRQGALYNNSKLTIARNRRVLIISVDRNTNEVIADTFSKIVHISSETGGTTELRWVFGINLLSIKEAISCCQSDTCWDLNGASLKRVGINRKGNP